MTVTISLRGEPYRITVKRVGDDWIAQGNVRELSFAGIGLNPPAAILAWLAQVRDMIDP